MELSSFVSQRRQFSVEFKLNAVKKLELNNNNISKTALELNVERKSLRSWVKQKIPFITCNNKRYRKKIGCGRKCAFPIIEEKLSSFINSERRIFRRAITRRRLLQKAREISRTISPNFIGSGSWVSRFLNRNNFSFRKITHIGQQDKDTFDEIRSKITEHLRYLSFSTTNHQSNQIYNMDETPGFFDMITPSTITFKGEKNVEALSTGHTHSRFTIVLCIRLDGFICKTLIIFKGLKKIPKILIPEDIMIDVSEGGSMNERIMKNWLDNCFKIQTEKSIFIMDNYGVHCMNSIVSKIKELNADLFLLPPRTTHYTQPLDVGINGPFKISMRGEWERWFATSPPIFTKKGYRKSPTYQDVVNFVSNSIKTINVSEIKNSFTSCGIVENGGYISSMNLNSRLRKIVENDNSSELSLSCETDEDNRVTIF